MTTNGFSGTEWVSFLSDEGETWIFDLSFFASNWNCIYGSGCAGIEDVPDVEGQRGCCSYGAHFAEDLKDAIATSGKVLEVEEIDYRKNVMAGMKWTEPLYLTELTETTENCVRLCFSARRRNNTRRASERVGG